MDTHTQAPETDTCGWRGGHRLVGSSRHIHPGPHCARIEVPQRARLTSGSG